ncbi:MAG: leucine--tRNA ligase, partial [Candidatus Woesearchaeota archaeon]
AKPIKGKKKFFGTFPYPYVNSYLHIGHFYSSMKVEALARYKRMQGYNVLYAQGWHCTGSPIVSTAKRIKEKEPKQINILKMQGFSDEEIEKFSDPVEWIKYFPKEGKKDFINMGYSIDWRREFITTELNPHYDKFIRWQFSKLKEKNYVIKGKFPVVWDPKENAPVGDHDRIEGEGETPQEYVLVKHKLTNENKWLVSATLRPDTIMGVTNLYVNPDSELVEAKISYKKNEKNFNEIWIISEKTANELKYQDKKVEILKKIKGSELIGKKVEEFSGNVVLVLPASFVNINVGTGIVHSVPSDSADDLIALYDIQKNQELYKKFNLNFDEIKNIKPIQVIKIPGYSEIPANDVINKLGIKNQNEREKLEQAKEILYKDGFYKGTLNELYSKKNSRFSKDYNDKKVEHAKEFIKEEIINSDFGDVYYQLTGKVVARSLSECVVKIVDDQWFMAYGNKEWKKLAHKCLDQMKLYPEKTRTQFNYVLDWLKDWACTREFGLGTRLPWDEKWLIESLSDSTIYMAYYTIAHKIKDIEPEKLDNNFFDYVFLGKNSDKLKVDKKIADELKQEFEYWYPMDFRNTGKDLIQNHMSFLIFNHVAIFPEKNWPVSFGLNGWVTVDGEKMSKSKGNFITMREANINYGADASRFTALSGGEGIDDANFDREMAKSMKLKLLSLIDFAKEYYNKGRLNKLKIDDWFERKIDSIIEKTTKYYDEALFRSALQTCYFEMQNLLKWYLKRTLNNPNKETINRFIETQALLLAPITPFTSEEIWYIIGKNKSNDFITLTEWPKPKDKIIDDYSEEFLQKTMDDINSVLKIVNKKPEEIKEIKLFISEKWKYDLYNILKNEIEKTRDFKIIMQSIMKNDNLKKHSSEITKIIQKVLKNGFDLYLGKESEYSILSESKDFLEKEFNCKFDIIESEKTNIEKAKNSLPGKPAILVE